MNEILKCKLAARKGRRRKEERGTSTVRKV